MLRPLDSVALSKPKVISFKLCKNASYECAYRDEQEFKSCGRDNNTAESNTVL
eukprot:m.50143 g.50143  ORF g.50143 m.50143 type:complete len:53 (+) comp10648_c0_seq2:1214-1372(+)